MRFKCGKNIEELDAAHRRATDRYDHLNHWHAFFALWPRKVAPGDCRWLETIERKAHVSIRQKSFTDEQGHALWRAVGVNVYSFEYQGAR